jgi:hypothetical protein
MTKLFNLLNSFEEVLYINRRVFKMKEISNQNVFELPFILILKI